ncbi:hypothetical protein BOTBODRAFT_188576 [Botryobasidium botryosum FD-172 SS1]|uniref:Uncharacterized protein n=1 Tax=Botryobasidium botryosum (strain FD-172 SS1) TaxID=930990 RepID=A0A067MF05_BOTB1|nr:hypothetical protein BOTBODRAFT_188576 [Botryobasidium botryosum FD-172 SS1]
MSAVKKSRPPLSSGRTLRRTTTIRNLTLSGACPAPTRPTSPTTAVTIVDLNDVKEPTPISPDFTSVFPTLDSMDVPKQYMAPMTQFDNSWKPLPEGCPEPSLRISMEDGHVEVWDYDHSKYSGMNRDDNVQKVRGEVILDEIILAPPDDPLLHLHHFEIRWYSSHPRDKLRHFHNTEDSPAFLDAGGEPERIRNGYTSTVFLPRQYNYVAGSVRMPFTLGLPQGYFAGGRNDAIFAVQARAVFLPRCALLTQSEGMAVVSPTTHVTMSHLYSDFDLVPHRFNSLAKAAL